MRGTRFARVVPRHPRIIHRLYAEINGYFWLPCIRCGRPFGGHERLGPSVQGEVDGRKGRYITCPVCARDPQLTGTRS